MDGAVFEGLCTLAQESPGIVRSVDLIGSMRLHPFLQGDAIGNLVLVGGVVICLSQ